MAQGLSKREAQQRADRIEAFRKELQQLDREQVLVLTGEQRSAVDAHLDKTLGELAGLYDIDVSASQKQLSIGMRIASALGGLALCAAVFLFFYRIWGLITTPAQVAILIATPLVGLVATELISRRERTLYFTALLALVTLASFVMNLRVLGQIFNLPSSPNAFLAWGLFAIVLAHRYGLKLILAAGLVSLTVFVAGTVTVWTGMLWGSFYLRPELPLLTGLAMIVTPLAVDYRKHIDFAGVYRLVGLLVGFLAVLILWHEGEDSYIPLRRKTVEVIYQAIAFLAAGATIWIGVRRGWQGIVNLGCAVFTIFLFIKFEEWWWEWMPKYLFFLIVGLVAIGLLVSFRKIRERTA